MAPTILRPWPSPGPVLFLDGAYVYRDNRPPQLQGVRAPDRSEREDLILLISQRAGRCLERLGLLEQDAERAWLELEPADDTDALHTLSAAPYPIGLLSARSKTKKRS